MKQSDIIPFDWQRMLMDQYPAGFLLEIIFRALIVFLVVVVSLRVTGRRGVKQLSLFELVFILTLGSAGGDAIFYHDVPWRSDERRVGKACVRSCGSGWSR